jgi:hypothetical protein
MQQELATAVRENKITGTVDTPTYRQLPYPTTAGD